MAWAKGNRRLHWLNLTWLHQLPGLAAAASARPWDEDMVASVLAAIAAAKGNVKVAEAALELSPDVAANFLEWLADQ